MRFQFTVIFRHRPGLFISIELGLLTLFVSSAIHFSFNGGQNVFNSGSPLRRALFAFVSSATRIIQPTLWHYFYWQSAQSNSEPRSEKESGQRAIGKGDDDAEDEEEGE